RGTDDGARPRAFRRHLPRRRRAFRATQPPRAQLPPAQCAGRGRDRFSEDGCPGQDTLDRHATDEGGGPGVACPGDRSGRHVSEPLLYEVEEGIARLTLNRPEKRNALNTELIRRLREGLLAAEGDPSVRVVTIRGAG